MAVLLDIDGVLTVSWRPLPGAVDTVRALRAAGTSFALLTNTTITLLRYLSEPELRESTTAITNRVEAFHGFAAFLQFARHWHDDRRQILIKAGQPDEDLNSGDSR